MQTVKAERVPVGFWHRAQARKPRRVA